MSEEERQKQQPNPFGFLRFRGGDERASIIRDLITFDKNIETKARIPSIFAMTYLDSLGAWSSPTDKILFKVGEQQFEFPKTVEGLASFFGLRYRINSVSFQGKSREEYERAASSWLAQQQAVMQGASQIRMEEGAKKSQ